MAVREFPTKSGPCDYLLIVAGKAAGVIEAKSAGTTLSGVAEQSARYAADAHDFLARWGDPLPFAYEATGEEIRFRDERDPRPRSRRVFAFHRPETLHGWLQQNETLRERLQNLPPPDVLAGEITDNLEAALNAFREVSEELQSRDNS